MTETGLLSWIQQFLEAQQQPEQAELLWSLYADDAYLALGTELYRKTELDAASFIAQQRWRAAQPNLPQYRLQRLCSWSGSPSLVWAQIAVSSHREPLFIALGLTAGQLDWCLLTDGIKPLTYPQAAQQALADYPWLLAKHVWLPRSNLDAGWWRLFPEPMQFECLPEARFSCQMSSACCRHQYEIVLPSAAQPLLDALPWPELAPTLTDWQLPVRADGRLQLKADHEACRFLDANQQCRIHRHLGRQPFGPCAAFPMQFARTQQGVAVSLSSICGSVRSRLGPPLAERQADLAERWLLAGGLSVPEQRYLAPGLALEAGAFEGYEQQLLAILNARERPLYQRLQQMSQWLACWRSGQEPESQAPKREPLLKLEPELQQQLQQFLLGIFGWQRTALQDLALTSIPPLAHRALVDAEILTDILRNLMFSKIYSYAYDLTTAHNLMILLYLVALVMQNQQPAGVSNALWQELASMGSKGLLSSVLPAGCPDGLRQLLGSTEFGDWALALPAEVQEA